MRTGFADGVGSTRIYITSVTASSLDAFFRISTVPVNSTEWHRCNFLSTFSIRSYERIIRTNTDDSFNGRTVFNFTGLRLMTWSVNRAWILAFRINTCKSTSTIVINPTSCYIGAVG